MYRQKFLFHYFAAQLLMYSMRVEHASFEARSGFEKSGDCWGLSLLGEVANVPTTNIWQQCAEQISTSVHLEAERSHNLGRTSQFHKPVLDQVFWLQYSLVWNLYCIVDIAMNKHFIWKVWKLTVWHSIDGTLYGVMRRPWDPSRFTINSCTSDVNPP